MSLRDRLSGEQKKRILRLLYQRYLIRDYLFCLWHGLNWRADWRFFGLPVIRQRGKITIGKRFTACSDQRYNSMGVFQRVMIKAISPQSRIEIGNDVGISGCSITAVTRISIGDHVLVGTGALIVDYDGHSVDPEERLAGGGGRSKPVVIERNVFIGARAIILKGVTIGEGSVIGAGAVVTKDVPSFCIAVGNPAKVIGSAIRSPQPRV